MVRGWRCRSRGPWSAPPPAPGAAPSRTTKRPARPRRSRWRRGTPRRGRPAGRPGARSVDVRAMPAPPAGPGAAGSPDRSRPGPRPALRRAAGLVNVLGVEALSQAQGGVEHLAVEGPQLGVEAPAAPRVRDSESLEGGSGRGSASSASASARIAHQRMAWAHCRTDSAARAGISSASCWAKRSSVRSETLASTAFSWPPDRVASTAAATMTGNERSLRAALTVRAASPAAMAPRSIAESRRKGTEVPPAGRPAPTPERRTRRGHRRGRSGGLV